MSFTIDLLELFHTRMHIERRKYLNHYFDLFFHGKKLFYTTTSLLINTTVCFLKKHYLHRATIIIVKLSNDVMILYISQHLI